MLLHIYNYDLMPNFYTVIYLLVQLFLDMYLGSNSLLSIIDNALTNISLGSVPKSKISSQKFMALYIYHQIVLHVILVCSAINKAGVH